MKHEYLLSGLLICAECGQRLHGVTYKAGERSDPTGQPLRNGQGERLKRWKTNVYYRCYGRHQGSRRKCTLPYAPTERLDALVWGAIRGAIDQPQPLLDQAIERQRSQLSGSANQLPQRIMSKERELERVTSAIDKTLDAYTFGDLQREEFRPRIDKLRGRKRTLEEELTALRAKDADSAENRARLQQLQASLQAIKRRIDQMSWSERRELLREWITRIIVHPDGHVEILGVIEAQVLNDTEETAESHCTQSGA